RLRRQGLWKDLSRARRRHGPAGRHTLCDAGLPRVLPGDRMMDLQRKIAILGATGSIGTQALDVARRYPERFRVVCLTARSSAEKLFDLVREFRPRVAALDVEPKALPEDVRFCEWVFGPDSSARALQISGADDAL